MPKHVSLHNPSHEDRHHLSTISMAILKSKRSIIITGAGISCNAGIPVFFLAELHLRQDFRSKDGLYNVAKTSNPREILRGKDLFDISILSSSHTASIYYKFIASLRQTIL